MQQDKSGSGAGGDRAQEDTDSGQQETLQWLIEQDYDDEPEKLFALLEEEALDSGLSALEAEIAARPMMSGDRNLDDLSTLVAEEIVVGTADAGSDIYSAGAGADPAAGGGASEVPMAIDHSKISQRDQSGVEVKLDDGTDILGLSEEDDIGEQFLVIKKVARSTTGAPGAGQSAADAEQATDDPVVDRAEPLADQAAPVAEPVASAAADEDRSGYLAEVAAQLQAAAPLPGAASEAAPVATDEDNAAAGDVFDYVAATAAPADEDEFDRYLLEGEHLDLGSTSIDDLEVTRGEGELSVDPSLDAGIDYHEDFIADLDGEAERASALALVIAEVMESLARDVSGRLTALGLDSGALEVETSLGDDTAARERCLEQGYVALADLAWPLPAALSRLGEAEAGAIHVRLLHSESGQCWNRLFHDGFAPPQARDTPAGEEEFQLTLQELPADSAVAEGIEGEDLVVFDQLEELEIEGDQGGSIEDILGDMDGDLEAQDWTGFDGVDLELVAELPEGSDEDDPLAGSLALDFENDWPPADAEPAAELVAVSEDDHSQQSVEPADTAPGAGQDDPVADAPDQLEAEASPTVEDFEEDIFGPDFGEELEDTAEVAGADVDALFDSLAGETVEGDDICGLAVDEFADSVSLESAPTDAAPAEAALEEAPPASEGGDMSWCIPADIRFSHSSQSQAEIFADFLDAFIEEGASELEKLEDAMGAWESEITSEAAYAPIPRILHTLKGIAKGVGLQRYGTLIHNFETLLEGLERPESGQEHVYFRIVHAWLDAAVSGFDQIQDQRADVASEFPTRGGALEAVAAPGEDARQPTSEVATGEPDRRAADNVISLREKVEKFAGDTQQQSDKQIADEGAKVLAAQQSIRMTPEAVDHLLNLTNQAQQLGVRSSQATLRSKGAAAELQGRLSSVRAHIAKIADRALRNVTAKGGQSSDLDALEMDQYSELQEAANILREGVEDLDDLINLSSRQNSQVEALLKQQASVISFLGSSIQAARVVPVSRLMPGLRRIVRTVSSDLGKAVQFKVLNEVGSLDRDNHARCQIILEHMVRNALDHGIENPGERIAVGKPTAGRITIDVRKDGGDYIVSLADDGRGDRPRSHAGNGLRTRAWMWMSTPSATGRAQRLIFHKGFSTAETLSEISGRGVGMDIVLSELQQIGGDIEIESEVGVGTTFSVRIPSNVTLNGAPPGQRPDGWPMPFRWTAWSRWSTSRRDEFYDAVENQRSLNLFGHGV